ncbi:RNA polymerase sigma-70 factor family protein [Fibrobacter succinogenes subsp. succinogenes S85]|uniref:RNA polymerase sigma-70 factor family protein n=1 Tax=Fibrobacter succinogenes (strain ATCC 19169 / S85) TaxID=59374 RepID=D9SBM3_FIBSS|nr:RNA polymerase sigma-70 factor family protein [Fibrobacter succinogenes subsp. succinogenes S85]
MFAKFPNSINLSKIFINCVSLKEVENIGNKTIMSYTGFLCDRSPNWVGTLWEKYSYRIYKLCLQKCGGKDEADDLFQEVALRFCQKAKALNNQVYLLPWLHRVLLNCHYNAYRKRNMGREIPFSSLCEPGAEYDASEVELTPPNAGELDLESVMGEIEVLLGVLNPLERMIVELSDVGGISLRELSLLIGVSRGSLVHRREIAFQKMQEKMMAQKLQVKMVTGRNASLREIIEYIG